MFRDNFTFSKRQLGLFMLFIGVSGFLAILAVDIIDAGREGGVGPVQQIALISTVTIAIIGLTLIPAGNDPA